MEQRRFAKLFYSKEKDIKLLNFIANNHGVISKRLVVHTSPSKEGVLPRLILDGNMIQGEQVLTFFSGLARPPPPKKQIKTQADLHEEQLGLLLNNDNWKDDKSDELDFTSAMHTYAEELDKMKSKRKPNGYGMPVSGMSGDQKDNLMTSQRQSDNVSFPSMGGGMSSGSAIDDLDDHMMSAFRSNEN